MREVAGTVAAFQCGAAESKTVSYISPHLCQRPIASPVHNMDADHGHYIVSADDLREKLGQVQLSPHDSDEDEEVRFAPIRLLAAGEHWTS